MGNITRCHCNYIIVFVTNLGKLKKAYNGRVDTNDLIAFLAEYMELH